MIGAAAEDSSNWTRRGVLARVAALTAGASFAGARSAGQNAAAARSRGPAVRSATGFEVYRLRQSSNPSPPTRMNSRALCVTILSPRRKAQAASSRS
jgi:hypothetical protein